MAVTDIEPVYSNSGWHAVLVDLEGTACTGSHSGQVLDLDTLGLVPMALAYHYHQDGTLTNSSTTATGKIAGDAQTYWMDYITGGLQKLNFTCNTPDVAAIVPFQRYDDAKSVWHGMTSISAGMGLTGTGGAGSYVKLTMLGRFAEDLRTAVQRR